MELPEADIVRTLEDHLSSLARSTTEMASAVYLDRDGAMLGARHFHSGRDGDVEVPIRAIVGDVMTFNARQVIVAHSHPGGDVEPSERDMLFTQTLFTTLEAIGVRLVDHLIVAGERRLSFRAERRL